MNLVQISTLIIPLLFVLIIANGLMKKVDVYDAFVDGAKSGITVVGSILPTLVGLMVAVGMLRASGFLNALAEWLKPLTEVVCFPSELVGLAIVRLFSSSAATGLTLDIFASFGPDSYVGRVASLLMSSTETVFYTMSIYFMSAHVKKTRYTLAGALFATLSGMIASVILAGMM